METRLMELLSKEPVVNMEGRCFIETNFSWKIIIADFISYLISKGILKEKVVTTQV
jgi:hypothetical protein